MAYHHMNNFMDDFLTRAERLDVPIIKGVSGVLAGALASQHVSPRILSWAAGLGFIGVGIWTLVQA